MSLILVTLFSLVLHIYYDFSLTLDVIVDLMSMLYTKPWVRIAPYLMGTLTAIYLHNNAGKTEISKVTLEVLSNEL